MRSCMFYVLCYHQLSDMLGSPWTDEEVERIYRAYTKCVKVWKKVCAFFVVKLLFQTHTTLAHFRLCAT
ncbi:hypothetical protein Hanom_Chr10g00873281 [Helianthus anomalus]